MINWDKWEELKKPWDDVVRTRKEGWSWDARYWVGNGDLLINDCRETIEKNDQSKEANERIETVFRCLKYGLRWPSYMSKYITTDNHTIFDITRDCWIYAGCDAVHLNRYDLIEDASNPFKWGPYREWWKALQGKKNRFWMWRWLSLVIVVKHTYVFWGFMIRALKQSKERNNEA